MRTGLRFRPIGWIAAIGTLAAMGATMVVAASGGAAQGPLKVRNVNFEAACILAPGVLNETGTIKVHQVGEAPEFVQQGEAFNVVNNKITTTTPVNWGETLFASGSRSARGAVTSTIVDIANATPAKANIAKPPEFPNGLPFTTKVENAAVSFTVPSENRSFNSGPYTVTGQFGNVVTGTVDTAPGFREVSAGHYEATGEGIVSETTGFNEVGEANIGPFSVNCTAPPGVVVSESAIQGPPPPPTCTYTTGAVHPLTIDPNHGPESGGTTVIIGGASPEDEFFFGSTKVSVNASGTTITPPGKGTVRVEALGPPTACLNERFVAVGSFTYEPTTERAEYKNWVLSGSLTDKKLGQAITLPEGATFNGSAEVNAATGAGSVSGNLAIPAFTAPLKLFGIVPVELGMKLTPEGSIAGTVAKSETISGDETLTIPLKLGIDITSLSIMGFTIPTSCATAESASLALADNLTREELLSKGWSFAGATTLPHFKCEGGFLSGIAGSLLTLLISGANNPYTLTIAP